MEIPDLIRQRLGDEEIESAVNLGDQDLVCFTPSRTLIYRSEGLISDDSLDVYDHDVERLDIRDGRRKSKFSLVYVDRTEQFSVARSRAQPVLERLLRGIMYTDGVLEEDESVAGVYRFSELSVIVTDKRLVKHIGSSVWDEDYEEFPYADVTRLAFEEGSVATQTVLEVDGRPHRIKAPNDEAPIMRETLSQALCAYYDVGTVEDLNESIGVETAGSATGESDSEDTFSKIGLDDNIAPLVGGSTESEDDDSTGQSIDDVTPDESESTGKVESGAIDSALTENNTVSVDADRNDAASFDSDSAAGSIDPAEFDALQEQVKTLTAAVQRQNDLLKQQHETIRSLVEHRGE